MVIINSIFKFGMLPMCIIKSVNSSNDAFVQDDEPFFNGKMVIVCIYVLVHVHVHVHSPSHRTLNYKLFHSF